MISQRLGSSSGLIKRILCKGSMITSFNVPVISPLHKILMQRANFVTESEMGFIDVSANKFKDDFKSSYGSESSENAEIKILIDRLFDATIKQIPIHGWSHEAVEQACQIESIPIGLKSVLMPHGPFDLVTRFYSRSTTDLVTQMAKWRLNDVEEFVIFPFIKSAQENIND